MILEPPAIEINWTLAPHIGPNVYVTTDIPTDPEILSYNGQTIAKLGQHVMGAGGWGWDVLSSSDAFMIETTPVFDINYGPEGGVNFWDAIYSVWGQDGSNTYIRLKDGGDPNALSISVGSNNSIGISIYGAYSDNVIEDIHIRGFDEAIRIRTAGASNNTIQNNNFSNFQYGVQLYVEPSGTIIRDNVFDAGIDGATPGAWGGGSSYETGINELLYRFWKYAYHVSDSSSVAIRFWNSGSHTVVEGNIFAGGMSAISSYASDSYDLPDSTVIRNNQFSHYSSVGITLFPGQTNTEIYGNSFSDINSIVRAHQLHRDLETSVYIYNNVFHNPAGVGTHIRNHWYDSQPVPTSPIDFYFYHNSFSGGAYVTSYASIGDQYGGLSTHHFVNNIFSSGKTVFQHAPASVGTFDNNWVGGASSNTSNNEFEPWWGANNILEAGTIIWAQSDTPPDWLLPAGHTALGAAGPLPAGYIIPDSGLGHNVGAVQGIPTGTGVVSSTVFWDQDGDGVQDAGELGLSGVSVQLSLDLDDDGTADVSLHHHDRCQRRLPV